MESPNNMGDLALVSSTVLQDNQWYHVALVFDGNTTSNDMHLYIDGVNEANGNYFDSEPFGGGSHRFYLGNVFAADVVRVDEARYYADEALPPSDFLQIATDYALTAVVNTATGAVSLHNDTAGTITINDYELNSPAQRLLASWDGLGNLDAVGGGDDPGETWENHGILSDQHIGESFLLGSSTIAAGGSLDIGTAYLAGAEDGDLTFRYADLGLGGFLTGEVQFVGGLIGDYNEDDVVDAADYTVWRDHLGTAFDLPNRDPDNSGNISQDDYDSWKGNFGAVAGGGGALANPSSNVPEPASLLLLLAAGGLASLRFRTRRLGPLPLRAVAALLALALFTCTAHAAVSVARYYTMGDYDDGTDQENGVDGGIVSSTATGDVLDSVADDGEYNDLTQSGDPVYHQITAGDVTAGHPGAVGTFGIAFDGTNYLTDDGPFDAISGGTSQGVQLWVYPSAAGLTTASGQAIVFDTINAGGPAITPDGMWTQTSATHTTLPGTVPVVGDTWHHVTQHIFLDTDAAAPEVIGTARTYSSVIYVDGVAVSANNDNNVDPGTTVFMIGAADDGGTKTRFFNGVLDELEVYTSGPDEFDLLSDNAFIAAELPGGFEMGDLNLDGNLDQDDVDAFKAGWKSEKILTGAHNSVYVGDLETYGWGDMNLDGRVNLSDAVQMYNALNNAGVGSVTLSDLTGGAAVPEPGTLALVGLLLAAGCGRWYTCRLAN